MEMRFVEDNELLIDVDIRPTRLTDVPEKLPPMHGDVV
jgi:hypothetical protein